MRQIRISKRRLAAGAFTILAAPVALGSVAYACQRLATLHANPLSAPAGSTVTLFGKNYSANTADTQIQIRLDGRSGRVIAAFAPRSVINNEPVTIPADVAAGTHTLVATQFTASGDAVSGTPGRATVQVTVAAGRTAGASSSSGAAAPVDSAVTAATPAAASAAPTAAAGSVAAPAPAVAASAPRVDAPGAPAGPAAPAATTAAPVAGDVGVAGTPAAGLAAASAGAAATATEATTSPAAAAPASVDVGGLLPASAESNSLLPGLTLAAGLALVLLSMGAFLKSGRKLLGGSSLTS